MTVREQMTGTPTPVPGTDGGELIVVVASVADARALAPLGRPAPEAEPAPAVPVLVATGPDPLAVDEILDALDAPAGRLLLLDGPCEDWAQEAARLIVRLDALVAEARPAGVVVRGGSESALAAARAAAAHGVPVLPLPDDDATGRTAATQALVAELAAWQRTAAGGVAYPGALDLLVHHRLAPPSPRTADAAVVRMPRMRGSRSSRPA